jgi:glycerol-3-phosphate responsive antiterminator
VEPLTPDWPALPRVFLSVRDHLPRPPSEDEGLLFHDLSLTELIHLSANAERPVAVDVDSVEGLASDSAALTFLAERLGIRMVITRRPALTLRAVELGCLPLLRIHCLDSTGLERALDGHPGTPVGTAISPGLILAHIAERQRRMLPPPVLAYGLMRRDEEFEAAWTAGAASVVTSAAGDPEGSGPGRRNHWPDRGRRGAKPEHVLDKPDERHYKPA